MSNLEGKLTGNLLAPLEFTGPAQAMNFAKNHRCQCGKSLMPFHPRGSEVWYLECGEHGPRIASEVITISQAERMVDNERSGAYELRKDDPPEHTEEENIRALYGE